MRIAPQSALLAWAAFDRLPVGAHTGAPLHPSRQAPARVGPGLTPGRPMVTPGREVRLVLVHNRVASNTVTFGTR